MYVLLLVFGALSVPSFQNALSATISLFNLPLSFSIVKSLGS
jgi:hypothetical protein